MIKFVLMLMLAFVSSNAMAEWVLVTAGTKASSFVDPSTIRRSGNIVKFSGIDTYMVPQTAPGGKTFMSLESEFEVDCIQEQSRRLNITAYSGEMHLGDVIYSNPSIEQWRPANRSTVVDEISKYVCSL
jgi:hypothetical protein